MRDVGSPSRGPTTLPGERTPGDDRAAVEVAAPALPARVAPSATPFGRLRGLLEDGTRMAFVSAALAGDALHRLAGGGEPVVGGPDGDESALSTATNVGAALALAAQRRAFDATARAGAAAAAGLRPLAAPVTRRLPRLSERPEVRELAARGRRELDTGRRRLADALDGAVVGVTAAIVERLDVDALLDRLDVGAILERVDLDQVLGRVDLDALIDRLDVDAVIGRVDVGGLVDRVDVAGIVDRVDVGRIVRRVDVDAIVRRVDVAAIVDRVDVARVVDRVDVDAIVGRTELGSLIVRSTSGVATEAVDLVRSQTVGLDGFLGRLVDRVLRRDPAGRPVGPPLLVDTAPDRDRAGAAGTDVG